MDPSRAGWWLAGHLPEIGPFFKNPDSGELALELPVGACWLVSHECPIFTGFCVLRSGKGRSQDGVLQPLMNMPEFSVSGCLTKQIQSKALRSGILI